MGLGLSIVGGSDTLLGAIFIHEVYEAGNRLHFLVQGSGSAHRKILWIRFNVGSNGHAKSSYDVTAYFKE